MSSVLSLKARTHSAIVLPPRSPPKRFTILSARIGADALAHHFDVGAHPLGHPRQLVHETDARGQHGVGRVLGELGAAHAVHRGKARNHPKVDFVNVTLRRSGATYLVF